MLNELELFTVNDITDYLCNIFRFLFAYHFTKEERIFFQLHEKYINTTHQEGLGTMFL